MPRWRSLLPALAVSILTAAGLALLAAPAGPARAAEEDTGDLPVGGGLVDEGEVPPELVAVARLAADLPLGARMKAVSDPLLGRPYLSDATGEGLDPDPDPPARYDAFDCLTFVEEVLALALPADPISAPMVRQGLRYGRAPARYENRRHFMLSEWIPGNEADGWVQDITASLGETHLLEKDLRPESWRYWRRRSLFQLPDDRLPTGHFELPLLSVDAALEAADRIPAGALILTVRQSREGVPIVVTHIGFKLPQEGDRPMVRHATRMKGMRVMDHSLSWYLEHLRWYDQWPVEGISVLMPRESGPRVAALQPPSP